MWANSRKIVDLVTFADAQYECLANERNLPLANLCFNDIKIGSVI